MNETAVIKKSAVDNRMSIYQILVAGGGGFIGGHLVAKLRTTYPGRVRSVHTAPVPDPG